MRPSWQSCQRGSFSMADQTSAGERERPWESPSIARGISSFTRTLPISKIAARSGAFDIELVSSGISDRGGGCRRLSRSGFSAFQNADDGGQNGNDGDDRDDVVDVLADVGDGAAQCEAAEDHRTYPEDAAENIEAQIFGVRHASRACDWRTESTNNGDEAGEDDGAAAVFFIKLVRSLQVATAEEPRIFTFVEGGARGAANPIADLVADDGAEHYGGEEPAKR